MEDGSSSSLRSPPPPFSGERFINGKLSSAAFQSLMHGNLHRRPVPGSSLVGSFPASPQLDPARLFPVGSSAGLMSSDQRRRSSFDAATRKLKFPKLEPVDEEEVIAPALGGIPTDQSLKICSSSSHRLPGLISIEHFPDIVGFSSSVSSSSRYPLLTLPLPLPVLPSHQPHHFPPQAQPRFVASRQRRKKISELTRRLEKLMPWEKKMDIATMLEEAHKYIRFLKAQVSVLQAMPRESNFSSAVPGPSVARGAVGLEKLSRQELLQVMLSSGPAQEKLYSSGCCVFSVEQMVVLKKMAERKALQEQMLMMIAGGEKGLHFRG